MKTINEKLNLLGSSFESTLYGEDEGFNKILKDKDLDVEEFKKNVNWDWTHGVGLYGYWKLYLSSGEKKYLSVLEEYFNKNIENGLPQKNINTVCPLLTMASMYTYDSRYNYLNTITEWSEWIMHDLPRTEDGGFQHITIESENTGELWDDTLFMTVLFLAKAGQILNKYEYIEEAINQFYIHTKYLMDSKSGLWYHGWTFIEKSNFVEAFWARGNSWITIFIPELVDILDLTKEDKVYCDLVDVLVKQLDALKKLQHKDGLWHTLIDDCNSYLEVSGSSGFLAGCIKSKSLGLIDDSYDEMIEKGLLAVIDNINSVGIVENVSYGTAMGKDSLDFYREIPLQTMPYGQSMAMLALIEYSIERKVD